MTAPSPPFKDVEFDSILKCVHCGLCLDSCPTYRELGAEQDSPRGRLFLMRGLWEGKLEPSPEVEAPLDRCLDCRACESACPSGVPYGELLEKTRGALLPYKEQSRFEKFMRKWALEKVLLSTRRLVWISRLGQAARLTGTALMIRLLPQAMFPAWFSRGLRIMPRFAGRSFKRRWRGFHGADNAPMGQVALFTGCVMDVADHAIHKGSLKLLQAAGCQVRIIRRQACCGALAVHAGERDLPRRLAEMNYKAFEDSDRIVVNAAGCGAQLKEYPYLFSGEQRWYDFSAKVQDMMQLLSESEALKNPQLWKSDPVTVFYDVPCHQQHAQGIHRGPLKLLQSLPGVTLVPLEESDRCCGAAGIYNLTQTELSKQVLGRKLDDLEQVMKAHPRAQILLTANPGCLYQLRAGCSSRRFPLKVMHPAMFMAKRLK